MHTIQIQHSGDKFVVSRVKGTQVKRAEPVEIVSPYGLRYGANNQFELMSRLRWYLEDYLNYPFPPKTDEASELRQALKEWGTTAFTSLFGAGQGREFYHDANRQPGELDLQICSDSPTVLSWPWEALEDPTMGPIGQTAQIERQLDSPRDPYELGELPNDQVNILLVTARPYKDDVAFRSISLPLVEMLTTEQLPASIKLLRPPTFEQLRAELKANPDFYHVVHFDGHGAYQLTSDSTDPESISPHKTKMLGAQGRLIFEDESGNPNAKTAEDLAVLLRDFKIPAVVLNACQSAMQDDRASDQFASVAAAMLKAGVRSVVAMAYSLYVSGAQQFLPSFYKTLFETGDVGAAVREGRQRMLSEKNRICSRGEMELDDWLVPVIYQQDPYDFSFVSDSRTAAAKGSKDQQLLADEFDDANNPYGFVGRDGAILQMERRLHKPTPAILIHGLGGVGKTTLARGFGQWLADTQGIVGSFWFTFLGIQSGEYVINRMGERLIGSEFLTLSIDDRIQKIAAIFREHRFLIVFDNFETICGNKSAGIAAQISVEGRSVIKNFIAALRGGKTKVVITSRNDETWLGTERFKLDLRGLEGEERWEYCNAILQDIGIPADRRNEDLSKLMDLLAGHPLLMRAILPKLDDRSAADLATSLLKNASEVLSANDELQRQVLATLRFVADDLPQNLQPLLCPLSFFEKYVRLPVFKILVQQVTGDDSGTAVTQLFDSLSASGLLKNVSGDIYEIHPALTGFLRGQPDQFSNFEKYKDCFSEMMATIANSVAPKPLHEQRPLFVVEESNIRFAFTLIPATDWRNKAAILQSLAAYSQNLRRFDEAELAFTEMAEITERVDQPEVTAGAYHQLGRIAQEKRDFDQAVTWNLKSLEISDRIGNEKGAASSYHVLGSIALERSEHDQAKTWYLKSLEINERIGNENVAAMTYHQLGRIAQEKRDFEQAEKWYLKSLEINERIGNEHGAASTYHQLGIIAEEKRDFEQAEKWYLKSLEINERIGNEHSAAMTYHHLGIVAEEKRDFEQAEKWYLKSLEIEERIGNEHGAAITYHQLGIIAQEKRDFDQAEKWYLKSLEINERIGNEHGAAITYHQLGIIAQEKRDFDQAEKWYLKSLEINERIGNEHGAANTYHQLGIIAEKKRDFDQAEKWYLKSLEINERIRNEHGAANTYHQLGIIAEKKRDFDQAEKWYLTSLEIEERIGNERGAASSYHVLGSIALARSDFDQAEKWYLKSLEINERIGNEQDAASTFGQLGLLAEKQDDLSHAADWFTKSAAIFLRVDDMHGVAMGANHFKRISVKSPELVAKWTEAGLPELPPDDEQTS